VQFCIAHLIRDIKFLTQLPDEPTQAYFYDESAPSLLPGFT
jgi:hypothetical protein